MARQRDRIAENVDGVFYVDHSCIDCDLCRQLAPSVFARTDARAQSFVHAQPRDPATQERALMALVTCPTSSIGTTRKLDSKAAARALPEPIAPGIDGRGLPAAGSTPEWECGGIDDVMFCGWASEASYGASSWLVRRPDGNVLVDSPRFASTLAERLQDLGGVRWMFLSHRDDVADHRAFARRFGCERILHRDDLTRDTRDVERVIDGVDPVELAPDLTIVPVPGHSRGSCVLIARETFAFTGDHVWASNDGTALEAGRDVSWYSWPEQQRSMIRLAEHRFTWVLPGHGRRFHAASPAEMRAALLRLAAAM